VEPLFNGLGQLSAINELPDSEIERVCGQGKAGCSIEMVDTVRVYYRTGDDRTMRHELCHVMHGRQHTVDYTQRVIAGDPRPICPETGG